MASRPVGHSHRRHHPEHRQETPRATAAVRALDVIRTPHRSMDLLVGRTKVQMSLQEPAVDLPPLGGDERLQLAVRHPPRLRGAQPRHQLGELLLRRRERLFIDDRLCFHALGASRVARIRLDNAYVPRDDPQFIFSARASSGIHRTTSSSEKIRTR